MTKNWTIIAVILVLVLVGLGYILSKRGQVNPPPTATPEVVVSPSSSISPSPTATISATIVKITSTGFSPQTVTIKAGDSVTWMNDDTAMHNVSSAPHPTHTAYPPLNLGNIAPGSSKSLTFPTAGTYKYHDHLNPSLTGSVIVE